GARRSEACARASSSARRPVAGRRIAVAATGPFGADVLERLAAEHDVVRLLTRPDKPRGRGRRIAPPPAKEAAVRLGIPVAEPQPEEGVTYAEKIGPEDRELDPDAPAQELVNRVRALSPHIGARRGDLIVWRARVGEDGSFEPLEVQPAGGRRMAYDAYLRGRR